MAIAAYPGTFNPPTVAHLAIAEAAWRQARLDQVHLVVSRAPLGKDPTVPAFEERVAILEDVAASRPWLEVRVTDKQLIAELGEGYDALVLGSDKWMQVVDPAWYGGSALRRDQAVAGLPAVLLAARAGAVIEGDLPPQVTVLAIHEDHSVVSSTEVRGGRVEWMLPEAAAFDRRTGAWSDPARYAACHDPGNESG